MLCHNPYFNRWFSAIHNCLQTRKGIKSHNPYFNRWFSAINKTGDKMNIRLESQSLF